MLRNPILYALAAILLAACGGDPPPIGSPTPTASGTGSAPSQAPTTPPPTVAPTPSSATASPTVTPTAPAGLGWTASALPTSAEYSTIGVIDVAFLDGLFVAVGTGWQEDERGVQVNRPLFWLSADGRGWQLLDDVAWVEGYIDALAVWQGQFVAAGYVGDERASAAFWTSRDGRSWERLPDRPVLQFYRQATEGRDIVAGGITRLHSEADTLVAEGWLYCACGRELRDGAVEWRTSDGREWERRDLAPRDVEPATVAGGPGWLRIAADGSAIESSADGEGWQAAWTPPATDRGEQPSAQLFALAERPGGFLAVGVLHVDGVGRPLALASSDGLAWASSTGSGIEDLDGALLDFAASPTAIVAVGRVGDPPAPYVWLHEPPAGRHGQRILSGR